MTAHPESLPGTMAPVRPRLGRLLAGVTASLVVGIIDIPVEISLAALVFSGALAGFVANGIGFFLFDARVLGVVVALTSSFLGMIALPSDSPAAILPVLAWSGSRKADSRIVRWYDGAIVP
jgi:hypothetical protein